MTTTRTARPSHGARAGASPFRRALIDLSFERGFAGLTIAELCRRAGVRPAVFSRRYINLEDCFYDVCRAELRRYRRHAVLASAGLAEWRSRLRATAYAFYRFFAEDQRLCCFALVEARAAGRRPALLLNTELEALYDLIDEGRDEPSAPASLSRVTAESLGGGIFNQIYCAAGHDGPLPAESEFVPVLMYSAVLPYLGAAAAAEELRLDPPPRVAASS